MLVWCHCYATFTGNGRLHCCQPYAILCETDASGNYKIENVPDGKYNVVAWHEGMNH